MNKYLDKIAEASVMAKYEYTPEYNRKYKHDYNVNEANETLVGHGFKPMTVEAKNDAEAEDLLERDFRAGLRPNEIKANRTSIVAGLGAGVAAAAGYQHLFGVPLLSAAAGLGAGFGIGGLVKRKLYDNPSLIAQDDEVSKDSTNKFLEYLKANYESLPELPKV